MYHCDINDIKGNNLHITDFKKLMPGTKLKIPFLNKEALDTLEETESFISDYYPKYSGEILEGKKEKIKEKKVLEEEYTPTEKIPEESPKIEEEKKPQVSDNSKNYIPRNTNVYFGNIPPNLPKQNIRKI